MAPADFGDVVNAHQAFVRAAQAEAAARAGGKSAEDRSIHVRIANKLEEAVKSHERSARVSRGGGWAHAAAELESQNQARSEVTKAGMAAVFLVSYNAVESILLACGILVNLAGIMFLSERFQGESLE